MVDGRVITHLGGAVEERGRRPLRQDVILVGLVDQSRRQFLHLATEPGGEDLPDHLIRPRRCDLSRDAAPAHVLVDVGSRRRIQDDLGRIARPIFALAAGAAAAGSSDPGRLGLDPSRRVDQGRDGQEVSRFEGIDRQATSTAHRHASLHIARLARASKICRLEELKRRPIRCPEPRDRESKGQNIKVPLELGFGQTELPKVEKPGAIPRAWSKIWSQAKNWHNRKLGCLGPPDHAENDLCAEKTNFSQEIFEARVGMGRS